jgi:hypothetical protein
MIKSKASRTTRKGRQHAILSTVVELNHGRKKKEEEEEANAIWRRESGGEDEKTSPATSVCVDLSIVRNQIL